MLALKDPAIAEAVCIYKKLTKDEAFRMQVEKREEEIRRYNSNIENAKKEGKAEGKAEREIEIAKNAIKAGSDNQFISTITGLSIDEINKLRCGNNIWQT